MMFHGPIYLDYNATTPLLPEVAEAMRPFLDDVFGNPSSMHYYGLQARQSVEKSRRQVAGLLGCSPSEIIFTSGGSESNNLAIKGAVPANRERGCHIITSSIEHPAVVKVCQSLEERGFRITYLAVDSSGRVNPDDVEKALEPETVLITIMQANNEVGTIQPIPEIARIAKRNNVLFHTDAAQAAGKIPVDVEELGVDLLSLAGHKFYAPKGIGALYIRKGTRLRKQIHGAAHEFNLRAGTENIMEIAGIGRAAEIAGQNPEKTSAHLQKLRDRLEDSIIRRVSGPSSSSQKQVPGLETIKVNGHPEHRLPNTLSLSFRGIEANLLIAEMADQLAVSAGAACHSENIDVSPTLKAMGIPMEFAMGTIRLSTGYFTTEEEVDKAAVIIADAAGRLKGPAPSKGRATP